ncbi:MAG: DUF4347 domain-containing protein [Elusimicrobia bacterium]|nr:DUF4347 domain-containing protein [Elusimicrobiota bacterium]
MKRFLSLAAAALLAVPAQAGESTLEAFASGFLTAAGAGPIVAGARAFGAGRAAAKKPAKPEIEVWVYNTQGGGLSPDNGLVLDASTRLDHALRAPAGTELIWVKDAADLKKQLEGIRDSGALIKKLVLLAHGASGHTTLVDALNVSTFKGIDSAFAPDAKIEMRSCSVASDEQGAAFVEQLGETFLRSGAGSVDAAKGPYLGLPVVGGCPWGTCTATVGADGCAKVTAGYDLTAKRKALTTSLDKLGRRLARLDISDARHLAFETRLAETRALVEAEPWTMRAALRADFQLELTGKLLESAAKPAAGAGR